MPRKKITCSYSVSYKACYRPRNIHERGETSWGNTKPQNFLNFKGFPNFLSESQKLQKQAAGRTSVMNLKLLISEKLGHEVVGHMPHISPIVSSYSNS